ncbi:hypothetical protein [Rubellimicrobium aerolatum]|uniref:Uncharacterized protein n=1 Tax=Rubellimicrobium aerolatum TaxID=490979 RepID=A0ABW0SCZ3_9RHOB|nr:hypothetical protein [Rubellimicrobium aerolatum]MBP1806708.1 hypothetical protein [Rubellimicrobium aerolatum]
MTEDLPEAVRQGLEAARAAATRRSNRLCLHDGGKVHRILRMWEGGFALAASDTAPLRGYVDLYDGPRHLSSCLIVALPEEDGAERIYEFKMRMPVSDGPPADFERTEAKPAALIPRGF